jgi:periplasmic divalent cation tolerance protein
MTNKIVVLSTCANETDANRVASALVESRVAACVSVVPGLRSHYRWKNVPEVSEEVLLVIKTTRELFDPLRVELEKIHPYEVPEILALPVVEGAENYLNWIDASVRSGESD